MSHSGTAFVYNSPYVFFGRKSQFASGFRPRQTCYVLNLAQNRPAQNQSVDLPILPQEKKQLWTSTADFFGRLNTQKKLGKIHFLEENSVDIIGNGHF